ncbi:RIP metalloprotease RseP [Opitutales bacterium]|nr:RIP metalloprotease RseP [Opitutales bacterium]
MTMLYDIAFLFVALFALGFTIFIHELGHFLAARQRGLLITRFSIGFGPKLFGWTRNGVEYRLSAIPFGGYVALPQLSDMGRLEGNEEQRNKDTQDPADRRSAWDDFDDDEEEESSKNEPMPKITYTDKMIVSVMGAVFNVLLAFALSSVLWFFGYDVTDAQLTTKIGYVADTVERWNPLVEEGEEVTSPAKKAGLLPGDEILTVDGSQVDDFMDIQNRIITGKQQTAQGRRLLNLSVLRNGQEKKFEVYPEVWGAEEMRVIGIGPKETFFIGELSLDMPAIEAGLQVGDQPISMNGEVIHSFSQLVYMLEKTDNNKSVSLVVRQGGERGPERTIELFPVEKKMVVAGVPIIRRLIGFRPEFKVVTTYPNPLSLIYSRVKDMYLTLTGLVSPASDVKLRNMSGPVGIVNHLSVFAKIGFKKLLWFVVFINVNLAILNLLPIPVLDGGHMLFATIEKLRGKPLPLAFLERAQVLFVALLFSFMLYVTFFDMQRILPF